MTYEVLDPTVIQIVLIGFSACISVLGFTLFALLIRTNRLTKHVKDLAREVYRLQSHQHDRHTGAVQQPKRVRVSDARYTPRRMETGADTEV